MKTEKFMNITDHERNEPYYQDFTFCWLSALDIGRSSTTNLPEMYVF